MAEFHLDVIAVLVMLLPGFLAARIEQRLTCNQEQGELDKIVEALLYSFVIYVVYSLKTQSFPVAIKVESASDGNHYYLEADPGRLVSLALIAIILSVAMSYATNHDLFGRGFRRLGVSTRTWRNSIWNDVFVDYGGAVQVELTDGRSVMGWLRYYSDKPDEASLFLEHAAWVAPDQTQILIDGPGILLTKDSGILAVSFLNWNPSTQPMQVSPRTDPATSVKPR
jgi:uncharacterized protein DUF6338